MSVPSQNQIREDVTTRIVEALESNLLPWRRPWSISPNSGRPANAFSKRSYSGVNPLLLELHRLKYGFKSRWWATFRQWSELGGCTVKKRPADVEPGHWGASILFCKSVEKETIDDQGEQGKDNYFLLRYITLFSTDQVDGELAERLQVRDDVTANAVPDFAPADELIEATGADVRHGGEQAFYSPSDDFIQMPNKHRFNPPGAYYESILHELSHWSEPRLGFDSKDRDYAYFELVAEMASCFLATELCVPQGEGLENHAAYLKSWLTAMKDDPAFIFKASTQASKVSDYLLSFVSHSAEVESAEHTAGV